MTQDEITRMAREAGATPYTNRHYPERPTHTFTVEQLKRFVAMVAAAESEECAKVCDALHYEVDAYGAQCAAAIRARLQPKKIKAVQEDDYCYGDERYYAND